ncbi:MAG: hypothetical protein IPL50_05385 [Chitinophagaceae bacterium]|nr:hypothetical protein [Chitinophagaceae bacterium]
MKKILTLFAFAIMATTFIHAQGKLSIENVRSIYIRNSGEIMDGDELKGYFTFYVSDKVDSKTNEYTVQIMDNNLNKIKDIKFEDDKAVQILESSYNGQSIMFLFYNKREKTLEYRAYNFEGKMISTYTKELTNRSKMLLEQTYGQKSDEGQNEALFSVQDQGYVTVYPVKEGKYFTYEVNFFFTDRRKQWSFEAAEEQDDKWATAMFLGSTDSLVIFEVIKQKRLMGGVPHSWLLGLNIYTGKKVFEVSTEAEDYKFYPMNISPIRGSSDFLLMGTYYEPDGKVMKDASLGLAAWVFNPQGKAVSKKYNSWDGDISKYIATDKKGRVADLGYVYFHKILQTADGNFFAIGEGYKKVASGLGIATAILNRGSGSVATAKLKITDLVTFKFNDKFEIKDAKIYDKNSNSQEMQSGAEYSSPHTMAVMAKAWGFFDYDFTQTNKEHTRFSVCYSDYVRDKDFKGKTFNSITYNEGKMTTDKIELTSKAKWLRVFPAKTGSVMIMEYFKKDKRLEMRLEKLN